MTFRPMLACKYDPKKLEYPVYVQRKYDGIRAVVRDGVIYSRNLKPIRNKHIQNTIAELDGFLDGLDGELIVGDPGAKDCYRKTSSGVMREADEPDFRYYVFDYWPCPDDPFKERINFVRDKLENLPAHKYDHILTAYTELCMTEDHLASFYEQCLKDGYEGIILRSPDGRYKYNRSTTNEGFLLKHKPFLDAEATIIGYTEKMHNLNAPTKDYLRKTKRAENAENMLPADTLGSLRVLMDGNELEFRIGTGFDDVTRQRIWDNKDKYMGKLVKFRYTDIGNYDVPRFPSFLGFRDKADL